MRKGHVFESEIKKVMDYIINLGYHAHKNHPERTVSGKYLEGEPFDWEVFTPKYRAVFDAKECASDTWHMQEKDLRQANNLKKCRNAGLEAYFLINFSGKVKQLNIDKVIEVMSYNRKSFKIDECVDWELMKVIKEGGLV